MEFTIDTSIFLRSLPFAMSLLLNAEGDVIDFNSIIYRKKIKPSIILKELDVDAYISEGVSFTKPDVKLFGKDFRLIFIPIPTGIDDTIYLLLFDEHVGTLHLDNARSMFMWFILNRLKLPLSDVRSGICKMCDDSILASKPDIVSTLHEISRKLFELHSYSENVYYLFAIDTGIIDNICKGEDVNISAIVREVTEELLKLYVDKGIKARIDIREDIFFPVDRNIMRRILENVVGNAFLYSYEGGSVDVSVDGGSEEVTIVVRDEGVGMDEAKLQEIFALFESREYMEIKGTLGLRIARSLIDFLNGNMIVESQEGKGTRVTIMLYKE
ncbi:MAG: HAMP domain-containing histidine kinase [Synergistetes bacterium]|nr:HAMP domain-containing histidine kinase [Synergistota bacterium]